MDPELDGRLQLDPVVQEQPPGPQIDNEAHAAEVDRLLAELSQEGAPPAPSAPDAPPGTWTWENIKKNLKEVPGQVVRGGAEGLNAVDGGINAMAKWLNTNIVNLDGVAETIGVDEKGASGWLNKNVANLDSAAEKIGITTYSPELFPDSVIPAKPETALGSVANDASQLVVGLIGTGKLIKVAEGASALKAFGTRMLQGAAADATVFSGNEENLANFVEKYPSFAQPVAEFLATHPEDGEAIGRLKNAVSGAIVGAGMEALIGAAKLARATIKGDKKAAQGVLDEIDAADDAIKAEKAKPVEVHTETSTVKPKDDQLDLFGAKPEPTAAASKEAPVVTPKEGEQLGLDLGDTPLDHAPNKVPEVTQAGQIKAEGVKPVKKIVTLEDDNFKEFLSARDWNKGLFQGEGQAVTTLNTKLIENADEIAPTINAIAEAFEEQIAKARGGGADGVVTFQETKMLAGRIADLTGGKEQLILNQLARDHLNMTQMAARMKAYADFHATVAAKVDDLATQMVDGTTIGYASPNHLMADFAKHTELLANVQAMFGGAKTNVARTLNAFKIGGEVDLKLAGMNPDELFAGGPAAMKAYAARIKAAGGNPKAIGKITERGLLNNLMKFSQQIWINGILSAPATHLANTLGSAAHMAYLPSEKMFAGAIRAGTKEGRAQFVEGALEYKGLIENVKDSLKLAANAFKNERPMLDPGVAGLASNHGAMTLSEFTKNPNGTAEWLFNTFSKATNMSSRLMLAEDEFIKQMAYRSNVRARAHTEWRLGGEEAGTGKSLKDFVEGRFNASVDPKTGQGLDKVALEQANKVTFSNSLETPTIFGTKSWGEIGQKAINDHPYLRFVMPFVRTPTNIGRFMWSRTPGLNLLRKEEFLNFTGRNGEAAQAEHFARTAMGGVMLAGAAGYAAEGTITGGGPKDPETRKALESTGWKPYSVKVTQEDGSVKYISYARMDPFASFLGITADLSEAAGHLGDDDLEAVASHMGVALANQLKNKSYMTGLNNLMDALAQPEQKMQRYIQSQVGSWVPSALRSVNSDPYMREARSVVEELRKRTPGLSREVDPVRNLFGEKVLVPPAWGPDGISPFLTGAQPHLIGDQPVTKEWQTNVQADVADELARQSYIHGSKLYTVPKDLDGVDLTEIKGRTDAEGYTHTALDQYRQLMAQPDPDMPTLRQALQEIVISPEYQQDATDGIPGEEGEPGSRQYILNQVIGAYRKAARSKLFEENPEVYTKWIEAKQRKAEAWTAAPASKPDPLSAVNQQ